MTASRRWYLAIGGLLVSGLLFAAIFADYITPVSPHYMATTASVLDGKPPFPPGQYHLLGTDEFARDVWTRVVYGTRWSLFFALLIMLARMVLAIPLGVLAAFGPRVFGWLVGRLYIFTSAVPPLLVYLLVLARPGMRQVSLWPSVGVVVALTTLIEWPRVALLLKGRLEELSAEQFVEGAIAAGARPVRIFLVHLLPHLWPTLLQTVAAEMGRALLTLAQLGIFGILIGGGIWELIDAPDLSGAVLRVNVTGIPEWGTLLAESRALIRRAPWIPLAPATAFLIGVTGFNLLSQGLEGIDVALARWKEATTGRLSARWRWALVPLLAAVVPLYGALWVRDQAAGAWSLARQQTELLTAGDIDGYLATLAPDDPDYVQEQSRWVGQLLGSGYQVAVVQPGKVDRAGRDGMAQWSVSFGYEDRPPTTATRSVRLVKRDGKWFETRGEMQLLRGFHVDVQAYYNPLDPSPGVISLRADIRRIATAADRAYRDMAPLLPGAQTGSRPRVIIYRDSASYLAAVAPFAPPDEVGSHTYRPGEALRVSTEILKDYNYWDLEKALAVELHKVLVETRLGQTTADPVAAGLYHLTALRNERTEFWLNFFLLVDQPLRSLSDLFSLPLTDLGGPTFEQFRIHSVVLVQFLESRGLSPDQIRAAGRSPEALAALLGTTSEQLAAQYRQFLLEQIAARSILPRPEWRATMPDALLEAVDNRAAAAARGDRTAFLDAAVPGEARNAETDWFETAERAGLTKYVPAILDFRVKGGKAAMVLLEDLQLADGMLAGVVNQEWHEVNGRWLLAKPGSPLTVEGR